MIHSDIADNNCINPLELIIYDFDGVMTDNHVYIDDTGKEMVCVNRGDGYAISRFKQMGIQQIIISTEKNPVVTRRADKLGIPVIQDASDKANIVETFCAEHQIDPAHVIYVGNDLNDITAMMLVGYKCAPADAEPEILKIADWISVKAGGHGVIRDLYRALDNGEIVGDCV